MGIPKHAITRLGNRTGKTVDECSECFRTVAVRTMIEGVCQSCRTPDLLNEVQRLTQMLLVHGIDPKTGLPLVREDQVDG
jgi:hypothetical protein